MNVQATCSTHAASSAKRSQCRQGKSLKIRAIALGVILALSAGSALAQSAESQSDSLQALAGANGDAPVANANDEAARLPMRRYSKNRATNERLNAVFHLIATEGNGLVWDGPDEEDETPPAVLASVPPKPLLPTQTLAKTTAGAAKQLAPVAANSPTANPQAASSTAKAVPPILSAATGSNATTPKANEPAMPIAQATAGKEATTASAANSAPSAAPATIAAVPAPAAPVAPAPTTAAAPAQVASAPASAPPAPVVTASVPAVPVVSTPIVRAWEVKPNSTLRDTLAEWAREAGWNEPKWKPADPIVVLDGGDKTTLQGTFIEALQALADAAPQINIYASQSTHEITVSDTTAQ